jgi:hypothetical protein
VDAWTATPGNGLPLASKKLLMSPFRGIVPVKTLLRVSAFAAGALRLMANSPIHTQIHADLIDDLMTFPFLAK